MARLPHSPATPVTPATPALARAVREWSGWLATAAGAVLSVLGWYGVSGESVIEQQLPYLASATIPGAALIVSGAVLIATRPTHRTEQTDQRIETLYTLLVADAQQPLPPPHEAPPTPETLLAIPGGALYHRRDCPLVADKPTAQPIDPATAAERNLTPCPVCEPPPPPPPTDSGPDQPAPDRPGGGPQESADQPAADLPAAAPPADSVASSAADQPAPDLPAAGATPGAADRPAAAPAPNHPPTP